MMDSDNEIFKDDSKTVCIIGSGLSGLTCGMKLAKAGFNVTVVEELASRGGKVEITGTILNTDSKGNGKIIALDGYGSAKITNNTDIPIELKGIDLGDGNRGTITLTRFG